MATRCPALTGGHPVALTRPALYLLPDANHSNRHPLRPGQGAG
jgi:hypothetical protein